MGCVLLIFLVICVVLLYSLAFLGSVLWCPLRFPHGDDVRFVFASCCLVEDSCLIYVICVCLHILVSNTYCVVFLLCCLRLVYPMFSVSLDCPFLIAPWVFSNGYLVHNVVIMAVIGLHINSDLTLK